MRHHCAEIDVATKDPVEFLDCTERVCEVVAKSGIRNGLATVATQHTTAAVRITERCERLQQDMRTWLNETIPAAPYRHDEQTVDDRPNARGHLMAMLMPHAETIPIVDGKLKLGQWQSIFFVEVDGPRPERRLFVQVIGER